jgi:glycosyltransferase involved in cell wall biosynthesis
MPATRRLLVISYHFPPDGTIGGQRWAGLTKYLARTGWEVHVITASAPGTGEPVPGVHRHFCARRRTLNDVYRARISKSHRPEHESIRAADTSSSAARKSSLIRALATLRRAVGSSMSLPDHGRGWVARATAEANRLMRDLDFYCVVSSGPPHSAHLAGLLATRGTDTKFWIDMRDPWALTHEMNTPEDSFIRAERRLLALFERLIFPHAEKVFANTREFASALQASQPRLNVVHFPNGIDMEQLPPRNDADVEPCSISYVGTLYAGRDLSTVFGAIRDILSESPAAASLLRVNVAGPLESPHRERMRADIDAAGLASLVNVLGVLPRDRALDLLSRSHLALVLAQDQPMCVPAKLYECVGLGVPTLVIAERNSAAAREARRIGAMTLEGDDSAGLTSLLKDMLAGRIPTRIEAKTPISYEDLANEMDRLLHGGERSLSRTHVVRESVPVPV